jgi:Flp pilus assembly protein CpaB
MRNVRPWLMLILALVSGGLAGYLALQYLRQQASPLMAAEPRSGQVALATRDLALGTVLTPQDVKLVEWPGNAVPGPRNDKFCMQMQHPRQRYETTLSF